MDEVSSGVLLLRRRLAPRWPPYRMKVERDGSAEFFSSTGCSSGFVMIGAGIGFVIIGVALRIVAPFPGSLFYLTFVVGGALVAAAGLWLNRYREDLIVDSTLPNACVRVRRAFRVDETIIPLSELRVTEHSTELINSGSPLPSWKGHSMCLRRGDKLLMVLALGKKRDLVRSVIFEPKTFAQHLYQDRGEHIIADI